MTTAAIPTPHRREGGITSRPRVIARRLSRWLAAAGLAALCAGGSIFGAERWLEREARTSQPRLPTVDLRAMFADRTPVSATITVGGTRMSG